MKAVVAKLSVDDMLAIAAYTAALRADSLANPGNATLAQAVAHFPSGNDSNGAYPIALTGSLYDSLSPYAGWGTVTNPGGNISLNSSLINWDPTNSPFSSGLYSGLSVTEHEIDEILGGGGAGSTLGQAYGVPSSSYPPGYYGVLDLYRYSALGTPSYSTTAASSYFSVDGGATSIVGFNQTAGGDYADFANICTKPHIQDAYACANTTAETFRGSVQDTMLQALGYNDLPAPAPMPGGGLLGLGFLAAAGLRKRFGKLLQLDAAFRADA